MPLAHYDEEMSYESGTGGLALYIPTDKGYVNYNFVHTIDSGRNADMWRLSIVNLYSDEGDFIKQITKTGAEWEMAIRLADREDFIGGYAHGDEHFTSLSVYIDNVETDISTLNQFKQFDEIKICMDSEGYDPADGTTKALEHHKEYTITKEGITINQKVTWLGDYTLCNRLKSFFAMMPPLKHTEGNSKDVITDFYYTNNDTIPKKLPTSGDYNISEENVTTVCVFGEERGIHFTMSQTDANPKYNACNLLTLSDNDGQNYNKMYLTFAFGNTVSAGDVWSTTTTYNIEWK